MNPFRNIIDLFRAERGRWLLWASAAMGAGIAVYFALPFEPPFWGIAATPLLLLAMVLLRRRWNLVLLAGAVLAFVMGFNAAQIDTKLSWTPMLDRQIGPVDVAGRLMFTEVMPEGVRITLKNLEIEHLPLEATPVKIRIKLNRKTLEDLPPPRSRIHMWAQIGPFSDPVLPHATDFRWQGYFKQMGGIGWSYSKVELAEPASLSWRDRFNLMFEHARLLLARHVYARLSGDVTAMTAARLNGEQTAISKPVIEAMRIAGLAHLLSTSGFHVTIMGLLVYFPLCMLLAIPILGGAALEDCEKASLVIAPFVIRDCAAWVIDDPDLWRHGAYAVYFDGSGKASKMRMEYTRVRRGERPWSVGWKAGN